MTRWVLLRGLTREAGHWGVLTRLLARSGAGEVLTPDLPGNGSLWRERSPSTVADMAAAVRKQLPAGDPAWVLAMSLGGMVAIEWTRTAPSEIAGCVLLNTSAGNGSPPWHRLRPRNYAPLARLLLPGLDSADRERRIIAMTSGRPQVHDDVVPRWAQLADLHPVSAGNALLQLWAAARYRAPADRPGLPLLLLASDRDGLVRSSCSLRLARQWGVDVHLHPWAGHDLPLDDPAWVVEQAVRFRQSVAAR